MKFQDWVKNASVELGEAIGTNTHNSDIWMSNTHKAQMLPYYLQYKMLRSNQLLVYATWGLAIVSIILSGLTLYFQYFR